MAGVVALVEAPITNLFKRFCTRLYITPFTSKLNHIQINLTNNQRNLRQDWWYMCSLQYVTSRPTDISMIAFSQNRRTHASGKLIQSWCPQSTNSLERQRNTMTIITKHTLWLISQQNFINIQSSDPLIMGSWFMIQLYTYTSSEFISASEVCLVCELHSLSLTWALQLQYYLPPHKQPATSWDG